jgi:predicted DNA-binding transcriptional regulator YafY
MATTINKKINHMFLLMERLAEGEELYAQHEELLEVLGVSERTLDRYLKDIYENYEKILVIEKLKKEFSERKVTVYRVAARKKDVSKVLRFFMENSNDLGWVLQMINENDPSFLKDLDEHERFELEHNIKEDEGIFLFRSTPFENLEDSDKKNIFSQLRKAVKNHEYRTLIYDKNGLETLKDVKCLKLIYMNNNWYLAVENEDKLFRMLRLSFVKEVQYASSGKTTFQSSRVDVYNDYFSSLQNAMTLVGKHFEKAVLKVSPGVAIYFEEKMKPFFPSQEYMHTEEDGSIVFSIAYTQPLEILPFIKQWQPDICIVSPEKLKKQLVHELQQSLQNHQES